jgi:hypothetical protein
VSPGFLSVVVLAAVPGTSTGVNTVDPGTSVVVTTFVLGFGAVTEGTAVMVIPRCIDERDSVVVSAAAAPAKASAPPPSMAAPTIGPTRKRANGRLANVFISALLVWS